jgi:hypothetical protein
MDQMCLIVSAITAALIGALQFLHCMNLVEVQRASRVQRTVVHTSYQGTLARMGQYTQRGRAGRGRY